MRPILLAGTTDSFARHLYEALDGDLRGQLRMWPDSVVDPGGLHAALAADPLLLVMGPGLVDDVALGLAEQVDAERSDVGVILIQQADSPRLEDALAAGVRGVLSQKADAETIRATFAKAVAAAERHAGGKGRGPEAVETRSQVTTVISPKGGAGKTVLSTNLAVGLASTSPRGVVLVDLDLQFGDVAYALGLRPRHTIFDAVTGSTALEITTLKVFLTHHQSDLYALCAPDDPARGEAVDVEAVREIVALLAADFDHVVVDTGAGLIEHTLATLDLSTEVVLLADMDVPSVRHLTKVVSALDRLGMTSPRRHIVLNRADARVGLSMPDVAAAAGLDVGLEIPLSKQIPVSINEGVPIILSNPRNPVTRKMWELVERLGGPRQREARPPLRWSA